MEKTGVAYVLSVYLESAPTLEPQSHQARLEPVQPQAGQLLGAREGGEVQVGAGVGHRADLGAGV